MNYYKHRKNMKMWRKKSRSPSKSSSSSSDDSATSNLLESLVPIYDMMRLIQYVWEVEDLPTDLDWFNLDLHAIALSCGRQYLIKLLLEKGCSEVKHSNTDPSLHNYICKLSWSRALAHLLSLGASVNNRNCRGETAVHLGFMHDTMDEVFDSLLDNFLKETKENFTSSDGLSLLHIACAKSSSTKVFKLLQLFPKDINQQVPLDSQSKFPGYSPLHFAARYKRYEIVQLLLINKADFCVRNLSGTTPLHVALYYQDIDVIDLILSYDQKQENYINNFGFSHFMAACAGRKVSVVEKYLHKAQTEGKTTPSSMIKSSVMRGVDMPFAGYTPLHFAAKSGNYNTVKLLLEHGANPQ